MVIKFPIHWFCIAVGFLFCLYGAAMQFDISSEETIRYYGENTVPLIIDAGHGGADGGALGIDGIKESEINLDIALRLQTLCHLFGVPTVMTRTTEGLDYPTEANSIAAKKTADQKARLRLIRDYPHAILFSIHQNTYPSPKVSGIQVLYGHSEESATIGKSLQSQMNNTLNPASRRVAAEIPDDIYLLKNCNCTAVLIECGFISNPNECKLLQTDDYQKKLVLCMLSAYQQYLKI